MWEEHELIALIRAQLACEGTADHGSSGAEVEFPIEFEGLTAVSLPMLGVIRQIRDAAAVMDRTEGQVKQDVFRAVRKLRAALGPDMENAR